MCELKRTIWPVGHGAFYTEVFDTSPRPMSVVYDCGGKDTQIIQKNIKSFLSSLPQVNGKPIVDMVFISHFHKDHINGLKYLLKNADVKNLIIPQIDQNALLEAYLYNACANVDKEKGGDITSDAQNIIFNLATEGRIEGVANLVQVYPYNESYKDSEQQDDLTYDVEEKNALSRFINSGRSVLAKFWDDLFWEYIPVNIYEEELVQKLGDELQKLYQNNLKHTSLFKSNGEIDFGALDEWLSNKDAKSLIWQTYQQVFGKGTNPNAYSMPVYSGPVGVPPHHFDTIRISNHIWRDRYFYCDDYLGFYMPLLRNLRRRLCSCLYMGDFEPNNKYNNNTFIEILRTTLKDRWHYIGLQQIPHHASPNNYCDDLYDHTKLCFANVDGQKDCSCSFGVLQNIVRNDCFPIVVTGENKPLSFEIW